MASSGISFNLSPTGANTGNGIGQGIDVNSIVSQIINADRAPEQVWQLQQADLTNQAAALVDINSQLSDFASSINALKDPLGGVTAKTVGSSDPSILTANAQTSAASGVHTILVGNLATTSSAYTDAVPTGSGLSAGALTVTVGAGTPASININSNETLDQLAASINSQSLGFTANVISDANGSRLSLVSKTIGQPGNLTIAAQGSAGTPSYSGVGNGSISGLAGGSASVAETFTLTATDSTHFAVNGSASGAIGTATVGTPFVSSKIGFTISGGSTAFQAGDAFSIATLPPPLAFHQTAGTNASLTIDGVPITSTSNTVTGVIPGVTLHLLSQSPNTPVQLNVAPDNTQATQAINNFVNSYNTLIKSINTQFVAPVNGAAAPPLEANGSLRSLQSALLSEMSYSLTGNNGVVTLRSLGVNMNNDGTLTVDSSQLSQALASNFSDVQNFFQSLAVGNNGFAQHFSADLANLTDSTQGILNLELNQNTAIQKALTTQINDFEDRLAVTQQQLIAKFSQINAALEQLPLIQNQIAGELGSLPR